ncbi:MAG: hypothetical protein PW792_14920 [Acidobacteriaceae bacterium]|nr:hypothetical protein [Acidobacteriaceae bacterium]
MQQITPAMVVGEIEVLLKARRDGQPVLPRVRVPKHTAPQQLVQLGEV